MLHPREAEDADDCAHHREGHDHEEEAHETVEHREDRVVLEARRPMFFS